MFIYYNILAIYYNDFQARKSLTIIFSRHAVQEKSPSEYDVELVLAAVRKGKIINKKSGKYLAVLYDKNSGNSYSAVFVPRRRNLLVITWFKRKGRI